MAVSSHNYWRGGEPFVWLTAAALAFITLMTVGFVSIVIANALGFYWPKPLKRIVLDDGEVLLGTVVETTSKPTPRMRIKVGNRDLYGQDFRWLDLDRIRESSTPSTAVAIERMEYGHFYGFIDRLDAPSLDLPADADLDAALDALAEMAQPFAELKSRIAAITRDSERLKNKAARLRLSNKPDDLARARELDQQLSEKNAEFERLQTRLLEMERQLRRQKVLLKDVSGTPSALPLIDIVRVWYPNTMSVVDKAGFYASKLWELVSAEPRESNTEGGIFPAIFGTVMLVLLMSLFSIPFGVLAAVYLHEYARDGRFVRLVRIAVNNLAGVPSIVYGVFGLGFFVYTLGGSIDQSFFAHHLPAPTYGTGGILWAALTLGLLTVPVVIVATEESLAAIPSDIRHGSLALGATKFQTLIRIILPMASPGILTGLVLAMARAAGEVAPLMLTGAVKLAPHLPLDSTPPFVHLDRKFMHLGFHIYDLAFQSPNVEAVLPMVYVTTLLLLLIVIALSGAAIVLRNRMRRRYTPGVF